MTVSQSCLVFPDFLHSTNGETDFLPARRYASANISRRRVSVRVCVCVSVCHTPVLYQNG